jgi:hypothetical protein
MQALQNVSGRAAASPVGRMKKHSQKMDYDAAWLLLAAIAMAFVCGMATGWFR